MIEKNIHHSKTFKIIIASGAAIVVILLAFLFGIATGFQKASFSCRVGEHYDNLFVKNSGTMLPPQFDADAIPGGHEAAGKIVAVDLPVFVVIGPDNIEKKINIAEETVITELRSTASSSDLKVGDSAVVIGVPGAESDIDARFIRIFPAVSNPRP